MAVMIVFENSDTYQPVRLTGKQLVLGRSSKSHLQLKDSMCSGQHASLQIAADGNVVLTDLNSTNGTYINETLVSGAMRVYVGDVIRLGDTRMWIDKSALSPREIQILVSNSNKTSFTKLELPGMNQDKMSVAKAARRKALGASVEENQPEEDLDIEIDDEEEHHEISVVFDGAESDIQEFKAKAQRADEDLDIKLETPAPKEEPEDDPLWEQGAQAIPKAQLDVGDGSETLFEMEASSGKTKMIKLDKEALPSRKKTKKVSTVKKRAPKKEEKKGLFGKMKKIFGGDD